MRRRTKGLLAILVVVAIAVPSVLYILNGILNPPPPEPLNLDEAPAEIRAIKADLKHKLSKDTFAWNDMDNFSIFSNYVAAHHPEAQEITKDWEIIAVLEIIDTGYLWFTIEDDTLTLEAKLEPPDDPDVTIILSFDTIVEVFSCKTTAAAAFQRGEVDYDGTLGIALKIDRLNTIFSYTIMDEKLYYSSGIIDFEITENSEGSYTPGYTLFPCIEIIITNESMETGAMGTGKVLILDDQGNIVNQLDDSMHSVHKFINSTAVMMGGSEGWMEIWDFVSDTRVTLPVPAGHHELDYNPITKTFMVLETATSGEMWDGLPVIYDTISEYNWEGDLLWEWDARAHYPFNSTIYTTIGHNYTFRGYADWMHANSFVWDKVENTIWLNVRNQDTLLKIDKDSGEIIWQAGRNGNFTVLDINGAEVDTIFNYPHSLEWIGSNRYVMFDNGLFNPDIPTSMTRNGTGISGFIEFEIDEENQILREVWSWYATNSTYYFSESGGDADRLPDGNTLGIYANQALVLAQPDPVIFAEVTRDGTIAWELQVLGGNGTYYWAHRVERFYDAPLIEVHESVYDPATQSFRANISVWNCVKQMSNAGGELRVVADGVNLHSETFEFQPQWIPTNLEISLDNLPSSVTTIDIVIENSDGIESSLRVHGNEPQSMDPVFYILGGIVVAVPIVLVALKRTGTIKISRGT
ncbi:MAG: aryl-sulfate sulfotransferase [Candidatus Thorarchaeota archaeon]